MLASRFSSIYTYIYMCVCVRVCVRVCVCVYNLDLYYVSFLRRILNQKVT